MVFVGDAFATERSSAMRAPRRGFAQWMEKAARVAQARRGGQAGGQGWHLGSHSSKRYPRREKLREVRQRPR